MKFVADVADIGVETITYIGETRRYSAREKGKENQRVILTKKYESLEGLITTSRGSVW